MFVLLLRLIYLLNGRERIAVFKYCARDLYGMHTVARSIRMLIQLMVEGRVLFHELPS
jgi:hypothetical protein